MAKKKKSKKQKRPNIPIETMARPRLEQILTRRRQEELTEEAYIAAIKSLMTEIGQEAVLNALIGALENANDEKREALMIAIPNLGNAQTIDHLWQLVRRSKMSVGGKMTALVILKQMGETVDLENPGQYFSWRDVKQADVAEIAEMGQFSMRAIIKELRRAQSTDEVEAIMGQFTGIIGQTGGEATARVMMEELVAMGDAEAADLLAAFVATTPYPEIREVARQGLLKLSGQNVFPQSELIKSLREERFYAAYSTDPTNPWQQGVILAWERSRNAIQAMVFLLDFGHPWGGAIKDMFVTHNLTPQQLQRELIDKAGRTEVAYRRVTYGRARQFILDAIEANRKSGVNLPPEYQEFRHLVERRIIEPSPETLAYAEQVDAETVDKWGDTEGEPMRGMEIIGPDGEAHPIIVMGELEDETWDEEFEFEVLLDEIHEYYYPEEDEEEREDAERILPYAWLVNYLTARYDEGVEVEELEERWGDLYDFLTYLEESDEAPASLADIQGFQVSDFVTDFWDEQLEEETPLETKRHVIETVRDLYAYLAAQKHVGSGSAQRVAEAAGTLLSQPDQLTPISKSSGRNANN